MARRSRSPDKAALTGAEAVEGNAEHHQTTQPKRETRARGQKTMSKTPPLPHGGEVIECWDRNGTSAYYWRNSYTHILTGKPTYYQGCIRMVVIRQPAGRYELPRATTTLSISDAKLAAEHAAAVGFEPSGCLWTRWSRNDCPVVFEWLVKIYDGWRFPKADYPKYPVPDVGEVLSICRQTNPHPFIYEHHLYAYRSQAGGRVILIEHRLDSEDNDPESWRITNISQCNIEDSLTRAAVELGFYPEDCTYEIETGGAAQSSIYQFDQMLLRWVRNQNEKKGRRK